jgi:ADP-heptose:LPS heptosyltransferase
MQVRLKQKIDKYAGYGLIALLWPFTRLLGIFMRRDHSTDKPPQRILFIKLLGLGSLIVAADAVIALRRRFPQARLILLTDANIAAGIGPFGLFDEIHATNTDHLFSTVVKMIRFFGKTWTWRRLWVVDLEVYSKLTTVLAVLTLARNRFGFYLRPVSFRKYLNTHNIPFDQSAYLGKNYETMAREMGGGRPEPGDGGEWPETGNDRLEPSLAGGSRRMDEWDRPYIILNNTCSGLAAARRLPDETFAAVCQWILEHTSYRLALLGGQGDREDINQFIAARPALSGQRGRILNFAGATEGFEEYYHFLREAGSFLVTIDSGPLHMARRLGLPTISIWGPTDPANYLSVPPEEKDRHLIQYLSVPCSPCVHRHATLPCGGNNICMKNIPVAAITDKIRQMLDHLSLSGRYELSQGVESGSSVLI